MTIRVIDGTPHVYQEGVGLVPVRGVTLRDAQALDQVVAFALFTGYHAMTVPCLGVVPDIREVEEKTPIGFRPRPAEA